MFDIVVSCDGVPEQAARDSLDDVIQEFSERPWHTVIACNWSNGRIVLHARNDYDSTGQALLDEFWDVVCACVPIDDSTFTFAVDSVTTTDGSGA